MRQRGISGATVLGHSFGGAVALALTLEMNRAEAGRIARLVLLDAPAYPQPIPRAQWFLTLPIAPYVALAAVPPILTARNMLVTHRRSTPPASDKEAIAYADPLYDAAGRHALITTTRLMANGAGTELIPHYPSIRQPVLLMWCRHDPTVPLSTGERLARELPRARLAVIEPCEHSPAEEAPAETLQTLAAFLRH
jgi:pimeloyl-ACP methyl ester carboxylesterase